MKTTTSTLDLGLWRAMLESRWQRKLDELIALSRACADVAADKDEFAGVGAPPYRRLRSRTKQSYDDLTAIETAIARVESYTSCT